MRIRQLHTWDLTVEEAIETQLALARRLPRAPFFERKIQRIGGADIAYDKGSDRIWAAVVVFSYPALEQVDVSIETCRVRFPYIPGLLSFREAPPILDCLADLTTVPDVLLIDAHGRAHPRLFGLACHVGLLASLPTIGCAKSNLVGNHGQLAGRKGSQSPIYYNGRKVGAALRTRDGVRPVYVSSGYRITLPRSVSIVLGCTGPYRIPIPIRAAHLLANRARMLKSVRFEDLKG